MSEEYFRDVCDFGELADFVDLISPKKRAGFMSRIANGHYSRTSGRKLNLVNR